MPILSQPCDDFSAGRHEPADELDALGENLAILRNDMVSLHELAGRLKDEAPVADYRRFAQIEEHVNRHLEQLASTLAIGIVR
jgi:hypothetical protein